MKTIMTAVLFAGLAFFLALTAEAADAGFYGGVGGGEARIDKKDLLWNMDASAWPALSLRPDLICCLPS